LYDARALLSRSYTISFKYIILAHSNVSWPT
jgi:hypothetical protein